MFVYHVYKSLECILPVVNNGQGISARGTDRDGMGMRTMRYRATLANGNLAINSGDTGGEGYVAGAIGGFCSRIFGHRHAAAHHWSWLWAA